MRYQVVARPWWTEEGDLDEPRVLASCDKQSEADIRAYVVSRERTEAGPAWGLVGVREIRA